MVSIGGVFTVLVVLSQISYSYGDSCWCPPFVNGWECTASRSLWGWNSSARVTYSISVGGNAGTLVCAEGYSAATSTFQSIGCGYSSFSRSLNWGNNIGMPKIKCKGSPFGVFVTWNF